MAFPKPVQAHIPLIIGAGGGPQTFQWIARHADGWMTTPRETDIGDRVAALKQTWTDEGREDIPDIRVLIAFRPESADLMAWAEAGVSELIWGVPDKSEDEVLAHLDALTPERRIRIGGAALMRVLTEHTYARRAAVVESLLQPRDRRVA